MAQLGLDTAPDKCEGPTIIIIWIGVVFDTLKLTIAIDQSKVEETRYSRTIRSRSRNSFKFLDLQVVQSMYRSGKMYLDPSAWKCTTYCFDTCRLGVENMHKFDYQTKSTIQWKELE